ncbi:SDR family oxidoreductase [Microcoleus sp. CAWBG640]|uniref:SDR family oxidoreductase n=1 Tax=Microcoleus sp. CAWBG640 TaxID=2841653 RepID=UPI00312B63C8
MTLFGLKRYGSQTIRKGCIGQWFNGWNWTGNRSSSLIQRFASTSEVAALVAFVASPLASAINGAALRVEGGVVRSIV